MKNRQIKPKPRLKTFHKSFLSRSLFMKCENDDTVLCQPNKIYLSKSRYDIKYLNFSFGANDYTACTWPAARARGREHVNEIRPRCWVSRLKIMTVKIIRSAMICICDHLSLTHSCHCGKEWFFDKIVQRNFQFEKGEKLSPFSAWTTGDGKSWKLLNSSKGKL